MTTPLRDILDRVASGQISPQEGQRRLAALEAPGPVSGLRIEAAGVRLTVLADPTVDTAVAEGAHRFERRDGLLVLRSDRARGEYSTGDLAGTIRSWIDVARSNRRLFVRVNPELPLEVDLTAGSVVLTGVRAPVRSRIDSASARFADGRGPLDLVVRTGSADVSWQFTGTSRVEVELSSATVRIQPGSDAVVTTEGLAASSRVTAGPGFASGVGRSEPSTPFTVGAGSGTLALAARLSSIDVVAA